MLERNCSATTVGSCTRAKTQSCGTSRRFTNLTTAMRRRTRTGLTMTQMNEGFCYYLLASIFTSIFYFFIFSFVFHFSLFTFHFSLFIFHSSFFIFRFSFFVCHFSFFIFHFSFFIFHFSFFIFHLDLLHFFLLSCIWLHGETVTG